MQSAFVLAVLVATLGVVPAAQASEATPSAQSTFPPNFIPTEIRRWVRDDHIAWDHITSYPNMYAPPWHDEARLGWLSTQPFANSHPLFSCKRNSHPYDHFTSNYEHCEGHTRIQSPYVLGYASSVQIVGTVPIYRCVAGKNEFDSTHPQCEGHRMVGAMGFIFP
jgi:hypothetical protein